MGDDLSFLYFEEEDYEQEDHGEIFLGCTI